jgi:GNAT superfamily N-acetyltransferase
MAISIRVARASDAGDVARLTAELGYDVAESAVVTRLSRIVTREDQRFLLAERDGVSVGWLHAVVCEFVETDRFVLIAGLVVAKAQRRSGIGRLLMGHAEEWARSHGCALVRLSSSSTRTAAHRFYERLGYVSVKTQYSFARSVDADRRLDASAFVPRVD